MNILILGSGGREHALAWKVRQSTMTEKLYIAPGNGGTLACGENVALDIKNHQSIIDFCTEKHIELVVVGPDDYLATGIVGSLTAAGIFAFGPTREAAEIEWSKAYAKEVMEAAGVPTARSRTFTDYDSARDYLSTHSVPVVVKASGLALGKGVTIAQTFEEADAALKECFVDAKFGTAGHEVLIEEFMEGLEFSVHAICAGTDTLLFPPSQDHKRIFDGDVGPNTGGMGVVAPLPQVSEEVMKQIEDTIVRPTLKELEKRGRPFSGILYPGIMLTNEGPKVIEFNARFGDPEAQVYMRLMESDIVPLLFASAKGSFLGVELEWKKESVACVVMASGGYPGNYEKGKEISGLTEAENGEVVVFHAGTQKEGDSFVTSGGRVLNVTATGETLKEALAAAYRGVEGIFFEGAQYRTDIGKKAL
ncbi:MAG: phosphoribosylamine--glycine ligase [Candidatus Pacebacteria bacterium]|nr:phosphoribosylamine--glycine ligase [Candidatus Paceibacterota bacterium]